MTESYGELKVQVGDHTGESKIAPWSSWWFPTKDTFMFAHTDRSKLAPLEKYDLFNERTSGQPTQAASYEEQEIYDEREVNWAGL